jgi:hypothetical protein
MFAFGHQCACFATESAPSQSKINKLNHLMRTHGGWTGEEDYYDAFNRVSKNLQRGMSCTYTWHVDDVVNLTALEAMDALIVQQRDALTAMTKSSKANSETLVAIRQQIKVKHMQAYAILFMAHSAYSALCLQKEEDESNVVTMKRFLEDSNDDILHGDAFQSHQATFAEVLLNLARDCTNNATLRLSMHEVSREMQAYEDDRHAARQIEIFGSDEDSAEDNDAAGVVSTCRTVRYAIHSFIFAGQAASDRRPGREGRGADHIARQPCQERSGGRRQEEPIST